MPHYYAMMGFCLWFAKQEDMAWSGTSGKGYHFELFLNLMPSKLAARVRRRRFTYSECMP